MDSRPYSNARPSLSAGDARLEAIIEAAVDDLAAGVNLDVESVAAAHPEYADRLRELFPMLQTMADLGGAMRDADLLTSSLDRDGADRKLGDFRLIRVLGRGGMGTVFEAEQISMGRRVAIKVLPFAAMANEKSLQRFHNEVRAAAALDHPNIVSVYSIGEERGVHFYAMQLIRGQTLAEHIECLRASRGVPTPLPAPNAACEHNAPTIAAADAPPSTQPLALARMSTAPESRGADERFRSAARLGIQAAEALQHAHDQGVLHRDVKPGNLMLDREGKLYITDFGLARIEADAGLTMTGDLLGTLRYMAPEQALGKPMAMDHRGDVYSLGAALYELVTLEPAFGESARAELLRNIAYDEPRRLQRIDRRIPLELESIILKAMAKEPAERYQSSQLMADDLRAFVDHRPIKARPASVQDRLRKWSRRHQTLAVVLALALSALSVMLAASMIVVHRARDSAVAAFKKSDESAARLADQLYAADMTLAYQAWEKGESPDVLPLLDGHRPESGAVDRRGYEWRLLDSLARWREPLILSGHVGPVREIAVFPDGRRLASVGDDGCLRIWEVQSGRLLSTTKVSQTALHSVAISPDGRLVAAGNETVYLCDVDHNLVVRELYRDDNTAESLLFTRDGAALVAGFRYHQICLISIDGAVLARRPCEARVESLDLMAQSNAILVPNRVPGARGRGIIELCREGAAQVETRFEQSAPVELNLTSARSSPCGNYVAAGARYESRVAFFRASTGAALAVMPRYRDEMTDLSYSPDGAALAAAYRDGVVQYLRIAAGNSPEFWADDRVRTLRCHHGAINGVRFLRNDAFATCGDDGLVKVWNVRRIDNYKAFYISDPSCHAASLSPDGTKLLAACASESQILDVVTGGSVVRIPHAEMRKARVRWSPRSNWFALWRGEGNDVTIYNSQGRVEAVNSANAYADGVDFSSDERVLAIIGEQKVWLADATLGQTIVEKSLPGLGVAVAFSHNADLLAYGGRFGELILASANLDHAVRRIRCPKDIVCLAFSPDDSLLASGHNDGSIALWNVASGECHGEIRGHELSVKSLAFTPDGQTLLSSAADATVRIASIARLRSYGVVFRRVATDPDAALTLSATPNGGRLAAFLHWSPPNQPDILIWDIDPLTKK